MKPDQFFPAGLIHQYSLTMLAEGHQGIEQTKMSAIHSCTRFRHVYMLLVSSRLQVGLGIVTPYQ